MPNGQVTFAWGDAEHTFNIAKFAQALELEEKCGCGVAEIFDRARDGKWHINDIRETLRLGLIGGGMKPPDAWKLIVRYFDERPWQESVEPALIILMAAMVGVPGDDAVGKKQAAEGPAPEPDPSSVAMEGSSAPPSTVPPPSSDSTRARPIL